MSDAQFYISVCCWIRKGSKFLIQKRSANDERGAEKWLTIGGKVEKGESLSQALEREIFEESGVKIDTSSLRLIKDYVFEKDGGYKIVTVFTANWKSGEAKALEEGTEVEWVKLSVLKEKDFVFETVYEEIDLLNNIFRIKL